MSCRSRIRRTPKETTSLSFLPREFARSSRTRRGRPWKRSSNPGGRPFSARSTVTTTMVRAARGRMRCAALRLPAPCQPSRGVTAETLWYADAAELGRVIDTVRALQPGLVPLYQADPPVLRGEFLVRDGGHVVERFALEVRLQRQSERALPEVRELGGRIPRHEDRHVSGDGTLCVVQPAAYWF